MLPAELQTLIGWDVDNEAGLHETFKEVIHEDKIRIWESTKAPDYCVQVCGKKLFYIEAKKPSVKIIDDAAAAFQKGLAVFSTLPAMPKTPKVNQKYKSSVSRK